MKNIITYVIAAMLLTACGTLKKNVNKQEHKSEIKSDSSFKNETTITETTDTNLVIPGDTTNTMINEADTAEEVVETPDYKIIIGAKKTGATKRPLTVITKPKTVPVKINKVTTSRSEGTVKKHIKTEDKSKVIEKEQGRFNAPWWVWIIVMVILIIIFKRLKII